MVAADPRTPEGRQRDPTGPTAVACTHCGLPVPAGRVKPGTTPAFCCHGCETVYQILHSEGFAAYYDLRDSLPEPATETASSSYAEYDDPAFLERHGQPQPEGRLACDLYLEGVHCAACLWVVEKALIREPGVAEARLNFARSRLRLVFDPTVASLARLARRLASLGYPSHPARENAESAYRSESRRLLVRMGVAGAVAGNVMLLAFALYGGWLSGMDPVHRQFFRWTSLVVTLPAVSYSAWPFYRSAFNGLRSGVLHMDLPISIGILAGFFSGTWHTITGVGDIYFDSVCALIFLLLVGRRLQLHQQRRASESSELLFALTPSSARRLDGDGAAERVPLEALRPGDRLEVHPGERIPTDGVVEAGRSSVDQSLLSGESVPVSIREGDEVWGGTTNLVDRLVVRATQTVEASRVGHIAAMVSEASGTKAPVVQLADRVAGWFVAAVLVLAGMTYAVWSWLDPAHAVDHTVALLVVSCPCALGLATPLAMTAAIGKAAREGILARSGAALEHLGRLKGARLFLDKTGTLTYGRMRVVAFEGDRGVLPAVFAAETGTSHPVGRALLDHAREQSPERWVRTEFESIEGGIRAVVHPADGAAPEAEGTSIVLGAPRAVLQHALAPSDLDEEVRRWTREAWTPVWLAIGGRVRARFAVADQVRPEARSALRRLAARGLKPFILSGDHPEVVRAIGRQLGLPAEHCTGGLSPEDKWERVRAHRGRVIMVGDGVNDAAAIAAADVGIAVHGGAETCFAAADVFLSKPGIGSLETLLLGSRRTVRTIRTNIGFSLAYNLVGATLAMAGLLNPLVAAVMMPASSLVVVTNSFRFRFQKNEARTRSRRVERPGVPYPI
ncbi:MAG TPA: heavy metal translocating P-type ATPase [Myxococcales bacterium LLY-WYZ-16_1]|nr:heavy metal translocating P-type ATPase [Myxococcales bacterium LLY-WYZ-16_1]